LSHDPAEVLPQETVGRGWSAAADAFFKDDRNAPAAAMAVRARISPAQQAEDRASRRRILCL